MHDTNRCIYLHYSLFLAPDPSVSLSHLQRAKICTHQTCSLDSNSKLAVHTDCPSSCPRHSWEHAIQNMKGVCFKMYCSRQTIWELSEWKRMMRMRQKREPRKLKESWTQCVKEENLNPLNWFIPLHWLNRPTDPSTNFCVSDHFSSFIHSFFSSLHKLSLLTTFLLGQFNIHSWFEWERYQKPERMEMLSDA